MEDLNPIEIHRIAGNLKEFLLGVLLLSVQVYPVVWGDRSVGFGLALLILAFLTLIDVKLVSIALVTCGTIPTAGNLLSLSIGKPITAMIVIAVWLAAIFREFYLRRKLTDESDSLPGSRDLVFVLMFTGMSASLLATLR